MNKLVIGMLLSLVTCVSYGNPARSIGPAIFVGGWAIEQLWLFIVAPLAGAVLAAVVYRGIAQPMLTAREAERALPTEQQDRLKGRAAAP